jgi:nitrate reductase gamma subunit
MMDGILDFARGPLFRFSFAILVFGLLRILALDLYGAYEAYRRAGDKTLPWRLITRRSFQWFFPVNRVFRNRPFYSVFSIVFHIGLLLVPIFLFAHVQLWQKTIGISWPSLPKVWADWLTACTVVFAVALFIGRVLSRSSSFLSRKQDYLWPLVLIVPFVTGFICANANIGPNGYRLAMLIHVLSANLIFTLIPFTKIAHCVLMPLSQFISNLAWKFPANTDEDICTTLNKKGAPV